MEDPLCDRPSSGGDGWEDSASVFEGVSSVVSNTSTGSSRGGCGTSANDDGGESDRGVPCCGVEGSTCTGGTTGVMIGGTGGVGVGRKHLFRGDPLLDFVDPGSGETSSGGILSPRKRASFETRLRRRRSSRSSFHFSHSGEEKRYDLVVEMEKSDDGRFLNEDAEGLGAREET